MGHYAKYGKKWRNSHKEAWNADKRRYYRQTANAPNSKNKWTLWEIDLVLKHDIPDSELSKKIGRSVNSIQKCRWKFKQESEVDNGKRE